MPDMTNVNKAHAAIEADEGSAIVYAILALRDIDQEVFEQHRRHYAENARLEEQAMRRIELPVRKGTGKAFVIPGHVVGMYPGWSAEYDTTFLIFVGGAEAEVDGAPEDVKAILEGKQDGS